MTYVTFVSGLGLYETPVTLVLPGLFTSARLSTLAGRATKGKARGYWVLRGAGDTHIEVELKFGLLDTLPTLVTPDGQEVHFAPPLGVGQKALILLPMILPIVLTFPIIPMGVLIGLAGVPGCLVNRRIIRSTSALRLLVCMVMAVVPLVGYVLMAGFLLGLAHGGD